MVRASAAGACAGPEVSAAAPSRSSAQAEARQPPGEGSRPLVRGDGDIPVGPDEEQAAPVSPFGMLLDVGQPAGAHAGRDGAGQPRVAEGEQRPVRAAELVEQPEPFALP